MRSFKRCFAVALLAVAAGVVQAQDSGIKKLTLDDLSSFKNQSGNWMIVGDVTMDPDRDVHPAERPAPPAALPEAGKKKKKKAEVHPEPLQELPGPVVYSAGKGILLNMNSESKHDNLITAFEHGDIELELEVMIPRGSNSGIYLQGRYEVQLLDSWGVRNPKFSDIGGIYRNWETEAGKIYMGKAPISNPAKAAGTWQKMKIFFRAPRFDAGGNKIANARFISVELNGVKIHDNLEVPLPTGGPIDEKEVPVGPLMIQGDHGPVAFRNIQYRLIHELKYALSPVQYKVYHGTFKSFDEIAAAKPVIQKESTDLSADVVDTDNGYAVVYNGTITIPETNTYTFTVGFTGGAKFTIGDNVVINYPPSEWSYRNGTLALDAGTYPFQITTTKYEEWMPARLAVIAKTSTSYPQTLTAFTSYPPDDSPTSPILINAGSEIRKLRAFVDFKGDSKQRLTHTIGIADPAGINYVYDLDAGNVVAVWRGDFVDATPMWHDRGDGSFRPQGAVEYLFTGQPLAFLASPVDAFPATGKEGEFRIKGYSIDEASGRPIFQHLYQGLEVTDKVFPAEENRSITHEVLLKERGTKTGLAYKLAEGASIERMANGAWSVDKKYFVKVKSGFTPVVRDINGKKELVVPFDGTSLSYTIVW